MFSTFKDSTQFQTNEFAALVITSPVYMRFYWEAARSKSINRVKCQHQLKESSGQFWLRACDISLRTLAGVINVVHLCSVQTAYPVWWSCRMKWTDPMANSLNLTGRSNERKRTWKSWTASSSSFCSEYFIGWATRNHLSKGNRLVDDSELIVLTILSFCQSPSFLKPFTFVFFFLLLLLR